MTESSTSMQRRAHPIITWLRSRDAVMVGVLLLVILIATTAGRGGGTTVVKD